MELDIKFLKTLVEQNKCIALLGYAPSVSTSTTIPKVIKKAENLDQLVFNYYCNHNLVTYLRGLINDFSQDDANKKVVIMVKPCDGKSIVELIRENQLDRDRLVILSMPCQGVVDYKKVNALKERDTEVFKTIEVLDENQVKVMFADRSMTVSSDQVFANKCLRCELTCAPEYDHLLGDAKPPTNPEFKQAEVADKTKDRAYWMEVYNRCIRCGACRNVCPMCYCETCVLERKDPELVGKQVCATENGTFLMIRAMHLAGRCIDCGRCDEVCPVFIDHEGFHLPLTQYMRETFEFQPGEQNEEKAVLSTAKMEEKADFKKAVTADELLKEYKK